MKTTLLGFLKLSFSLLLVLGSVMAASAQGQGRGQGMNKGANAEARAEEQTKRMSEQLALTADQTTKIKAINLNFHTKMQEARVAAAGNQEQMKASRHNLRAARKTEIKAVLTPEQITKWEAMKEDMEDEGPGKGGKKGKGPKKEGDQ